MLEHPAWEFVDWTAGEAVAEPEARSSEPEARSSEPEARSSEPVSVCAYQASRSEARSSEKTAEAAELALRPAHVRPHSEARSRVNTTETVELVVHLSDAGLVFPAIVCPSRHLAALLLFHRQKCDPAKCLSRC